MEDNMIIRELKAIAELDWGNDEQASYYRERAERAYPVQCVPMEEVFTPEQMSFIRMHYRVKRNECWKNASRLVDLICYNPLYFHEKAKYVEGFVRSAGLLAIDHAFVRVGDKYIDPTFERALCLDVRKEDYVALREFSFREKNELQWEAGYYGELYLFDWAKKQKEQQKNRPRH